MANPVGGLGQASAKMVEEIQKQAQQQIQQQQQLQPNKFNDVMQAQQVQGAQGPQQVEGVRQVEAPVKAIETLQAAKLNATDTSLGVKSVEASKEGTGKGFKKMLSGIVDGQNKLDEIIKMATSGRHFGQQELLAIQAGVYKYSQELELTSKVVEKATSGVKQTMQTQV
ncbi:MAG: ATP-dependent helicase HrpB [Deltaproteobacteria bacterium]|nr:ATP-dependent helicase HrpB [Deltaproteobacteria bacterium]